MAIAPSDKSIVWAGTGESFIRSNISIGDGVYKSTDAGKTWKHMGLEPTGRIARMLIDPTNPDIVFACAVGRAYGPQAERGVFRTTDGGKTWEKVLFVDEDTGCSDIAMSPASPHVLMAGMWPLILHTWGRISGGPGGGLYKSVDGGSTWTKLTGDGNSHGLPHPPIGKVGIAYAPSDAERIYVQIEVGEGLEYEGKPSQPGTLWRSDDGGDNWKIVSYEHRLAGRWAYYTRHAVNPVNENEIYFVSSDFSVSYDGGYTSIDTLAPNYSGAPGRVGGLEIDIHDSFTPGHDNHDIWVDPDGNRMAVANDLGIVISQNRGKSWVHRNLPVAQMYHVTVDNRIPYYVYGNKQDGLSYRGPSNALLGVGSIPRSLWHAIGGGEDGFATPDPVDPNLVWSTGSGGGSAGGIVVRFDERNFQTRSVEVWPEITGGSGAVDVKYRFNWQFPLLISPHDHNRLYVGSQFVHTTTDGGQSWHVISPDLTLNDHSKMGISGGLTPDNLGVEYEGVVFALAESPKQKGVIWAGTNDGLVQVTRDDGKTWTNVTANIPNLPPLGTVDQIEASRWDAGTAYIAIDFHQVNNFDPFAYKTTDFGKTWTQITNGIPKSVLSYAHCIREDPKRRGLLYLGTENALYVSFNDGAMWQPLQMNLPHAPVYGLVVQEHFNDLVIATYGRGFWILDDLSPIQNMSPELLSENVHLFAPRPAYRYRFREPTFNMTNDTAWGDDLPYGASVSFYLKSAPRGDARVEVMDSAGKLIRTMHIPAHAGINRFTWDLRSEPTNPIVLRTIPASSPWLQLSPNGTRSLPGSGSMTILEPPGSYTFKLTVDGKELSRPLTVLKDPNSAPPEADLQTQNQLSARIYDSLNTATRMINDIELLRAQLTKLHHIGETDAEASTIRTASQTFDLKLLGIEDKLFKIGATSSADSGRYPGRLVDKLYYLGNEVAGSDYRPTDQDNELYNQLRSQVSNLSEDVTSVFAKDIPTLNETLRKSGSPAGLIVEHTK